MPLTKDPQLLKELIKWFPEKSIAIRKCFSKFQEDFDSCEIQITNQRDQSQNFGGQLHQQNDKIYIQKNTNGEQNLTDKKIYGGSMAVPGAQLAENLSFQTNFNSGIQKIVNPASSQILLLNSVNQIENLPQYQVFLDRLQEEVIQDRGKFMQFLERYSQISTSFTSCDQKLSKIEIQMNMKDQQLEKRLGDQSIDTSKIEIFNSKQKNKEDTYELHEKQEKQYRYKGQAFLQPIKPSDPQANHSHLKDISGESYNNFKDSCWVILTGQKPTSGLANEVVGGKNENKKESSQHGSIAQMSNKARLELAMQESRLQHAKETALVQANKLGQITNTPPKGEGKLNMRASTLEREPGSTNINHLQQKQLAQIMLPQKRYGHSSTIIDDKLYIFGGAYRKGSGANFHSFHECQLKLDSNKDDLFKWRRIQGEAPKLRDSHSCVSFLDQLLIFGGGSQNHCFNDLYKFSITNKIWTKLESISDQGCHPSPREGHVAIIVEGDKMLVHGGINENQVCFNDAYILVGLHQEIDQAQSEIKFDEKGQIQNTEQLKNRPSKFEALRWFKCEQEGDVPSQRDSHSSVLANNQIYIFGGQDNDENLHNDFYRVTIQQTSKKEFIGDKWYYDKFFKLIWKKIVVNSLELPIKRTSHSMNLFMNRWLVLIGGETSIDQIEAGSVGKLKEDDIVKSKNSDDAPVNSSEEETNNKALNDVWLYDIVLNIWKEIKPIVKVQSCFNSKKMRKSFEPRMAHSADVWGNYIIIFGGYASQSNQYSPNNFCILSLAGCTDYMLQKPMSIKMIRDYHKRKIGAVKENNVNLKISIDNSNTVKIPVLSNNGGGINSLFQVPNPIKYKQHSSVIVPTKYNRNGDTIKLPGISHQKNSQVQTIDLQSEEQEIINRCNTLVENHNSSKLKFSLIDQLAHQIKNPLQLIIEIIKNLIDVHELYYQKIERYDKQKKIVNINQYGMLDISIHLCQYDETSILFIKDLGPGMTHTDLKVAMTGQYSGDISNKYDIFKYASLHLAMHTFVISKTQTISNNPAQNLNLKFDNEVHVGLLSSRFVKDSNSDYLIAPIVSFDVVENPNYTIEGSVSKYDLVAKTPLSEKFICLMLSYIGIFQNIHELKQHILQDSFQKDKFQTGTQIYLCELNEVLQSYEKDIYLDATKRSEKLDFNIHTQSTTQIEQMINENENLEHSLLTLIKYSYIDFPTHVNLQVNDVEVDKENPFNKIISYVLDNENQAIKGQTPDYRYWIISQQSLVNFGIDEKVIHKMEGLLIYKNNEFVKKDDLAQPHTYIPKVGSKRQILDSPIANDILHGIIMIETTSENSNLTIDKQDLVNQTLLQTIRDEIYVNYIDMREQSGQVQQMPEELSRKRMRYDTAQQIQAHTMYPQPQIGLCEYGQIAYPFYPNQNDDRITREEYDQLPDDKKQEYMIKIDQMAAAGAPMQTQSVAVPAVANYQNYRHIPPSYRKYSQAFQAQNPQETVNEKIMEQEMQKIEKIIQSEVQPLQRKPWAQAEPLQRIMPIELTEQQKEDYENDQLMQQEIAGFGPSVQISQYREQKPNVFHTNMQS